MSTEAHFGAATAGATLGQAPTDATASETERVLKRECIQLLAQRSREAGPAFVVGTILFTIVFWGNAPVAAVMGPVVLVATVNAYRVWLSRGLLKGTLQELEDREVPRVFGQYVAFATVNGLWFAFASVGYFGALSPGGRAEWTILVLLSLTGSVVTYASYVPAYRALVLLSLPPLAFEWLRLGTGSAYIIVFTLFGFLVTTLRFSRNMADVFEHSVRIRFEREEAMKALEYQQQLTGIEHRKAIDANMAKSRFLANASHDLRQPAQALALYTAVLRETSTTDEQREIADNIARASRALGGLLDNLLDLSRLDAGVVRVRYEHIDLQELVERLAREIGLVARERNIMIESSCPKVVFHTDPVLLERLLRNLLDNAVKFTEQGSVRIDVVPEAHTIQIDVSDTGPGIELEHQTQVFEEFFQSHNPEHSRERGLGLGLSIVSRLARVLEATVTLRSQPGEGTIFSVRLPFDAADSGRTRLAPEGLAGITRFDGIAMLVVDDDRVVCDSLARLLRAWGAQVDAVKNAAQALELANERQWRVCLSDLRLQHGEDGLDLAMALRARMPALSLIFVSGDIDPARIRHATRIGDALLHKPVDESTLARHIAQALHMG